MEYLPSKRLIVCLFLLFVPYWNSLRLSCAAKRFRNICYGMDGMDALKPLRQLCGLQKDFFVIIIDHC